MNERWCKSRRDVITKARGLNPGFHNRSRFSDYDRVETPSLMKIRVSLKPNSLLTYSSYFFTMQQAL